MIALARSSSLLRAAPARLARRFEPAALRWRRPVVILLHLALAAASSYAAFWLRFDGDIPPLERALYFSTLPALLLIRAVVFHRFRLFEGLWRYTSLWDLRNIVLGVALSSGAFVLLVRLVGGVTAYPRSVMLIDPILLICLMCGVRLTRRMAHGVRASTTRRRVLIIGAGDPAEMIVREMKRHPDYGYEPVGFVDDDPRWAGQRIHGLPVLGGMRDLVRIMLAEHPHEVLIAFAREQPAAIRAVVKLLEPFKVPLTRLPFMSDLVNGRATVAVTDIRQLRVEDLLHRAPIGLDPEPVSRLIEGRRILVTGAGGSIGSELCRQIACWQPASLVLFERYEGGLYTIESELRDARPDGPFVAAIGDVTDVERLDVVIRATRPDIIFHAAAHKHVPLMEQNPCEAVKNNVLGTLRVAEAAVRHGVGELVLISTDKAVHPCSVMGASKRIAELIVQQLTASPFTAPPHAAPPLAGPPQPATASSPAHNGTRFVTVRFGNVLGSSGSVVPRFLEQIRAGGPVTVTHPEIRRYFMLIPEAVQLVLQAAAIGEPGGVYVLDMGEQIKLVDIARTLIRLSGHVPDEEVAIAITGLRPGEKLEEQLVGDDEVSEASPVEKILRVRPQRVEGETRPLAPHIAALTRAAAVGDVAAVLRQMRAIVPTFAPAEHSRVSGELAMAPPPVSPCAPAFAPTFAPASAALFSPALSASLVPSALPVTASVTVPPMTAAVAAAFTATRGVAAAAGYPPAHGTGAAAAPPAVAGEGLVR